MESLTLIPTFAKPRWQRTTVATVGILLAVAVVLGAGHQPVLLADKVAEIGSANGQREYRFGRIEDAAATDRGVIFALDSRLSVIRAFDMNGRFLFSASGPGRESGRMFVPIALTFESPNKLLLLDAGNSRVTTFEIAADRLRLAGEFSIDFSPFDICTMSGRVYILGLKGGKVIHEYTDRGRYVRSFGDPFGPKHLRSFGPLARGHIRCADVIGKIVIASAYTPEVRGYERTGILAWTTTLADFQPVLLKSVPNGVRFQMPPEGKYQLVTALMGLSNQVIVLQLSTVTTSRTRRRALLAGEARFLSAADGRLLGAQVGLPPFLAMQSPLFFSRAEEPFQRLVVYRFRASGLLSQVHEAPRMSSTWR